MEAVVNIAGEKKKFQGSFKDVMEKIYLEGKNKEVKLLSIHSHQKELRRFKREMRKADKDILLAAKNIARWFYLKDLRRANRCIKDYRKKTDPVSISKVEKAKKILEEAKRKLETLT